MLIKINEIKAINLKLLCSILVILIPPSLITGPLFSDLFLSISCILFIIILYKEKKFYYFNNFFFKFFVFFWIYLIFNSLFSDNIFHSLKVSIFYIRFGIFCILVNFLICEYEKFLNNFFYVLLFTISFVVFDGFFQYFLGFNLLGFETIDYPRISGMFGEESILGSYISRLIPILVAFFFINKFNKSRIIVFLLLIVLCQVLVVLTGERTAAGIIILSTIFFVIFIKDIRILKSIGFIITIVAAATFIFLNLNNDIKKRIIDTTLMELGVSENKQVQITFEGVQPIYKNYYLFSPKHQSMYLTSFNMFKDKKVLGHGPRSFKYKCSDKKYQLNIWSCASHPHNIFFQIISERGIIGLIFYLVAIIYLFGKLISNIFIPSNSGKSLSSYQICLVITIIISIWPILPSGNFFNNWLSIIFYLPVGFYLNSIKRK